jgi:predicted exporter
MPHIPAHIRRWVYGIALAGIPLLVAFGIIEESQAPLWVAFIGAVVAPGLALANISPEPAGDETQEAGE